MGMQIGTPPVQNHGYAPPPPPAQRAPVPAPQAAAPSIADNDALMQQVMAMSQDLIDSLPPADRAQLMALRASFAR
jgi:hypothetical protein